MFILSLVFAIFVVVIMPLRAWVRYKRSSPSPPALISTVENIVLSVILLLILRSNGIPLAAVGLGPISQSKFLLYTALATGVIVGLDVVALTLARWGNLVAGNHDAKTAEEASVIDSQVFQQLLPQGRALLGFVPLCLAGAIWEELCFRGVGLYLAPNGFIGILIAVAASSVIFALHHLRRGKTAAGYSGFYGILFSLLYLGLGYLPSVMLAHAFGNLFVVLYTGPRLRGAFNRTMGLGCDV